MIRRPIKYVVIFIMAKGEKKDLQSKIANPKSKIKMAERTGLEPANAYAR